MPNSWKKSSQEFVDEFVRIATCSPQFYISWSNRVFVFLSLSLSLIDATMAATTSKMKHFGVKLEEAALLWLEGFREACCLHRVVIYCLRYNDIAKYGFAAMGTHKPSAAEPSSPESLNSQKPAPNDKPAGLRGVMIGIGEQIYSVLLLSFFFLEVYVTGFIPYIGKALNFLLLSWMYAYYCFEYKWNFSEMALDKRLDFFESNWAFFAGFGSPCVLAIFFFSPLVSYGVMAILFPLFVLTATGSQAEQVIASPRIKWRGGGLGKLPVFYVADALSLWILSLFPMEPHEWKQDNKIL